MKDFRKHLYAALKERGFQRKTGGMTLESSEVRMIIIFSVSRKTSLAYLIAGFWIFELSTIEPEVYNHYHIYGGYGKFFPDWFPLLLRVGRRDEQAMKICLEKLPDSICSETKPLLSIKGLRNAYEDRQFEGTLMRKEARELLSKTDA